MNSLRFRLTVVATVLVLAVLVAGGGLLFLLQRGQLVDNVDQSLRERADTIEGLFAEGDTPVSFAADDDDRGVQIVGSDGEVVVSSDNLAGAGQLAELPSATDEQIRTVESLPLGDDAFRLLSRRIEASGETFVVHVAENSDDLEENTGSLLSTLGVAIPALSLLFAALTWWLVGRTLRPVDEMRAEVDSISDAGELRQLAHSGRDDEIGRLNRTLNQMLQRLHRSGEQQRQFVADAAHELRTPLTRIRTNVEVDLAQPDAAVPSRTNAEVRAEAVGLQNLIDDLLHLAQSDSSRADTATSLLDLDDLVITEIGEQRLLTPAVTIDAAGVAGAELEGDELQLRRALQNLLANAARHARSTVAVTLRNEPGEVVLMVDDDGPGIAPEKRELVFDRFSRLDEARTADNGGAGLGLAITRDIVQRHHGVITCVESPLGGARFMASFRTNADH